MEEKREQWLSFLALTTVILAVTATLSTFRGAGYSTRSVQHNIEASNQWAHYQAKKIRAYLFDAQKESIETQLKLAGPSVDPAVVSEIETKLAGYRAKIKEWNEEMEEIMRKARSNEQAKELASRHAQWFALAVIFLQMAILLSSIATLMKRKAIWVIGLLLGLVGLVYFTNGILLLV
jgi:hypothetical protein